MSVRQPIAPWPGGWWYPWMMRLAGCALGLLAMTGCGLLLDQGPPREDLSADGGATDARVPDTGLFDTGVRDAQVDAGAADAAQDAGSCDRLSDETCCGPAAESCAVGEACFAGTCQSGWLDVAAFGDETCGLRTDGSVECWSGLRSGRQPVTLNGSALRINVRFGNQVRTGDLLAVGDGFGCVVQLPDTLYCWGGDYGAWRVNWEAAHPGVLRRTAGSGDDLCGSWTITEDAGGAAGPRCTSLSPGTGICYAVACLDQVLDSAPDASGNPPPVVGLREEHFGTGFIRGLGLGNGHGCFQVDGDGTYCFGDGDALQLGVPVPVGAEQTPAVRSAALSASAAFQQTEGGKDHHCGRNFRGNLWCWGGASQALYGRAALLPEDGLPTQLDFSDSNGAEAVVTDFAVGDRHGCAAIALEGTGEPAGFSCWGDVPLESFRSAVPGDFGPMPLAFPGLPDALDDAAVLDIAAGSRHTCAVLASGDLYCWGEADAFRLGCASDFACEIP